MRPPPDGIDAAYNHLLRMGQRGWLAATAGIWLGLFALAAVTFGFADAALARWAVGLGFLASLFLGVVAMRGGAPRIGLLAVIICSAFAYLEFRKMLRPVVPEPLPAAESADLR